MSIATERCEDCAGTGLALNGNGEPDECASCGGAAVVAIPVGWHPASTAPKDGSDFIACYRGYASFVCQFWRGNFVSFDPEDGVVSRSFDLWMPMPSAT